MIRRLVDLPGWESFSRISFSICRGLVWDNVCRARRGGYEDGREETMLLQGEIGSSATFLLGARTRFWRVVRFSNRLLYWTLHGAVRCLLKTKDMTGLHGLLSWIAIAMHFSLQLNFRSNERMFLRFASLIWYNRRFSMDAFQQGLVLYYNPFTH